jgi:hypothetical protein
VSKIGLHNYEAFMLDYLEGNLSAKDTKALKAFALLHPELELNFDEELVTLETEHILFENKQNLKAGFSDELVIGYLENVLDENEKRQAEILAMNNTIFKHELELYKKTIAIADASIVFENKERLKRRPAIILWPQNNFVRVAAALLLLIGLWFAVSRMVKDDVNVSPEMANKGKELPSVKTDTVSNDNTNVNEKNVIPKEQKLIAKKTYLPNKQVKREDAPIKREKEVNTGTVNVNVPEKKEEEPQLVNETKKEEQPNVVADTVKLTNAFNKEKLLPKYIIDEGVDDEPVIAKEKSKLWKVTAGLLKRLNRRGIENVNSSEETNEMYIGALTISKPN